MPDQYSSFDVARLSMDGANAGTTFSDSLGHTFTNAGAGVTTSTANAKFGSIAQGNASMLTTGASTAYISSPTTADWNMGSGDFCIDTWVYPTAFPTDPSIDALIFSIGNGTGTSNIGMALNAAGVLEGWAVVGTQKMLVSQPKRVRLNRWTHIALVRTSGTLTLYVNGFAEAKNTTLSTTAVSFSSDLVYIGNSPNTSYSGHVGYIDDFRITKGHARWTSNFVIPLANFNTSSSAITIQSIGTYTKQVVINGEADHNAVMDACIRAITTMGWDFYDIKNDRGQNIAVFRSLNKDGVSYKYALLIQNDVCQHMCITSCENWDKNSQTILNECFSGNRQVTFSYFAYNTTIQIMASNRWLLMFSYVLDSPSAPAGVIEMEREAPEDVPNGVPCWGYWNNEMSMYYTTNWGGTGNFYQPRTWDGKVGMTAGDHQTILFSTGAYGHTGVNTAKWAQFSQTNSYGMGRYAWDSSKINITNFRLHVSNGLTTSAGAVANHGRFFGLKGTPFLGAHLDRVSIPCDADNFYKTGETDKEHWIFVAGHRDHEKYAWVNSPRSHTPKVTNYLPGVATTDCAFNGRALYLAGSADVNKIDLVTGVTSTITVPGVPYNLTTDGRFVYGTTNNAAGLEVFRIDTMNSDNVLSVATTTTTHSITWDGQDRVIASKLGDAANAVVYFINTFSMTTMQTATLSNKFTTNSHLQGLSSNGKGMTIGCAVNAVTNTDCNIAIIDDDAMTAGWATGAPSLLANNMSARWDGYTWQIGYTSVANGNQGSYMLNPDANGNWTGYSTIITSTSVGATVPSFTSYTRANAYREGFSRAFVFGVWHWSSENSHRYALNSTASGHAIGSYPSSPTENYRWGYYFSNNMAVYQTSSNTIEIVRNFLGSYGPQNVSYYQNQFLFPK